MAANNRTRLYAGMTLLILAAISPLFGFLVTKTNWSLTVKTTVIGLLTAGVPEVLTVLAAAVLGKENFERIKSKVFFVLKRLRPTARVSKARYIVGLIMFLVPVIPTYVMGYVPQWLPDISPARLYVNIGADVIFIASLFVLGGDFWDKLTALFVYESRVSFSDGSHSPLSLNGSSSH
jgi:MFS family permease